MKYLIILLLITGCAKTGDCILSANDDVVYKVIDCNFDYCLMERLDDHDRTVIDSNYVHRQLKVSCK